MSIASAIHELTERAHALGTPLIDGDRVTFVWEGETAPELIADFNAWGDMTSASGPALMEQVAPGVWTYEITLPADAYVEYIFTSDPDDEDERLLDPLNRRQTFNGLGKYNNYFTMPGRPPNLFTEFMTNTPQGEVTRHAIYHPVLLGERRDVWLYHPPSERPAPLLVVFDGKDYLRRANITQIIANLIAIGRIQPVALALLGNARSNRYAEYNATDTVLAQITELVMPLAYNNLNLLDHDQHPGTWGVLGASMGGQQALYTALRLPQIFGKVITQSGAFQIDLTNHPPLNELLVRCLPKQPVKIWQDVGVMERLLDQNRQMHTLLTERGYDVTYREFNAGHNYNAWRDQLPEALTLLFGA